MIETAHHARTAVVDLAGSTAAALIELLSFHANGRVSSYSRSPWSQIASYLAALSGLEMSVRAKVGTWWSILIKAYFSAGATFRLEQSRDIPHGISDDACQKKIEGLLRAIERSMMSPLHPFFPEWLSLAVIEIVLSLL